MEISFQLIPSVITGEKIELFDLLARVIRNAARVVKKIRNMMRVKMIVTAWRRICLFVKTAFETSFG